MNFHVLLQGICCIKHLVASKTTIFRLKMITHVVTQLAFSFEVSIIRAHLAFKLFLITVSCLMVCQIRFSRKSFTASGTHVGFFSRVSSHVNCKVLLAFKTLQANFTLIRFIMYSHVTVQTASSSKSLVTNCAGKLFLFFCACSCTT